MEYKVIRSNDHLAHYGVKGMKWRIRQGYDRSGPGWDPGTGVMTVGKKLLQVLVHLQQRLRKLRLKKQKQLKQRLKKVKGKVQ